MLKIVLSALCGIIVLASASMASAQGSGRVFNGSLATGARSMSASLVDPRNVPVSGVIPSRLDRQRERNGVYTRQPAMSQILSSSQSELNTAGVDCRVVDGKLLGYNADQQAVYEVSCGNGMGYVVGATTPPQVTDCITISGRADEALRNDPAAKPLLCTLSANQNVTGMVSNYGRQAGVTCDIDDAAMAGVSIDGNAIYEVGCKGVDGYWVEKAHDDWILTPCVKVAALNNACRFTTHEEQAATLRSWLAETSASACDVTDVRYLGANAAGAFYETKCGHGDGYVARLDDAMKVQQVYPCAEAATIGGGCRLTALPAAQ
jgi:hypothetical protein